MVVYCQLTYSFLFHYYLSLALVMSKIKRSFNGLLLLISVGLYTSCSTQENKVVKTVPDTFQSYPINIEMPETDFAEVVESIELMQLEETDESLLSEIIFSLHYKDLYLFVANKDHDILFYDDTGNFIRSFNRLGEGPEEYSHILNIWMEGDTIGILDGKGRSVKKYNIEGDFISSEKLPSSISHLYPTGDRYLIQTNHNTYQDSLHYKWILTDQSLKPIDTYLPFDAPLVYEIAFPANYISPYKDGLVFYSMFTDSLHMFTDKGFSPLAHINFDDAWYWKDKPQPTTDDINGVQSSDKAWDLSLYVSGDYIFGRTPIGFQSFLNFMIDRTTGQVTSLDMKKPAGELYTMDVEMVDGERFLFSLPSDEVETLLSGFDGNQVSYKSGTSLERMESSENPVLIWVTFKATE